MLLLQRLAAALLLVGTTASAFVVVAPVNVNTKQQPRSTGTVMMAQRHYVKFTRGDFLLKSAALVRWD